MSYPVTRCISRLDDGGDDDGDGDGVDEEAEG